jgi:hypothetical protein
MPFQYLELLIIHSLTPFKPAVQDDSYKQMHLKLTRSISRKSRQLIVGTCSHHTVFSQAASKNLVSHDRWSESVYRICIVRRHSHSQVQLSSSPIHQDNLILPSGLMDYFLRRNALLECYCGMLASEGVYMFVKVKTVQRSSVTGPSRRRSPSTATSCAAAHSSSVAGPSGNRSPSRFLSLESVSLSPDAISHQDRNRNHRRNTANQQASRVSGIQRKF